MILHTCTVTHRHGINVYTDWTEEGLDRQVANYCRDDWGEIRGLPGIANDPPPNDRACIEAYFEARLQHCNDDEYTDYHERVIEDPPILDHYRRLQDGLSEMVEHDRLKEEDIPDDYRWLVETLATIASLDPCSPAEANKVSERRLADKVLYTSDEYRKRMEL